MGMMFGGWANDPYEQDERELEQRLGPEAYGQLIRQREIDAKKYREEHPTKWSKTEPKVTNNDVIGNWVKDDTGSGYSLHNEALVVDITDTGDIVVRYLDGGLDGQSVVWNKGVYRRVCSVAPYNTEGL